MISTPFCSHNFLKIIPISALICPYIAILRYLGANTNDTGISILCAANLRYLFPFLKTSWYFICAVGRPHFHYTRRSFHYIIFFTFPNRTGGCRSAKATQSIRRKIFRFYDGYSADGGSSRALATAYRIVAARRDAKRRARAVRIPPCKACYKNRKQHPARCCFWRRWWESNPRDIAVKLISS